VSLHWWWNPPTVTGVPPEPPVVVDDFTGAETTLTWAHLLREAKDPGDQPDAQVGTNRWMAAGRPTTPQY
jgi:hypothetical protein